MERYKRLGIIFYIMAKIGLFTFGGGWSIIAQMQNEFVDKRRWLTEEQVVGLATGANKKMSEG